MTAKTTQLLRWTKASLSGMLLRIASHTEKGPLWDSRVCCLQSTGSESSPSVLCLCATLQCCGANSQCKAAIKQTNDYVAAGLGTMHFQLGSTKPTKITLLFFFFWFILSLSLSQLSWPSHIPETWRPRSLLRSLLLELEACSVLCHSSHPSPLAACELLDMCTKCPFL